VTAPRCSAPPGKDNITLDNSTRPWGFENDISCAYKDTDNKPLPAAVALAKASASANAGGSAGGSAGGNAKAAAGAEAAAAVSERLLGCPPVGS
jgi:hypothetical protein